MTDQQPSTFFLRALLLGSALALSPLHFASAQTSSSVTVDLSAIDTAPLQTTPGRIVLRPPSGTSAISGSSAGRTIKLRPPQPKAAAQPAAPAEPKVAAAAPPPAPAPKPAATTPPPPAQTAVPQSTSTQPAAAAPKPAAPATTPPAAQASAPTPAAPAAAIPPAPSAPPSAAAVRSAQQESAGPVAAALPDRQQAAAAAPAQTPMPSAAEEDAAALSIPFAAGITDIDVSSQGMVRDLANRLNTDKALRVQLMAYATDPDNNTSKARRLALDRAIGIRNMLIEGGVERTRIEVRALGDQGEGGNLDRVDAVTVKR